jgi:hypothetical protein
MQKIFAKCLIAAVCVVMLAGSATAQRRPVHRGSGWSGWVVLTYTDTGGPDAQPVTATKGGGVSFDFYNTPDRALLITDVTNGKAVKPGTLTGRSLSASVAISATPGATFNYYDDNTGLADPGGFVRLYFQRPNDTAYIDPATGLGCGDPSSFNPSEPRCEAQYCWSTVYFDLSTLLAAGSKGLTLQVSLNPALWSDRMGTMGDTDAQSIAWFDDAVANANEMGLSFGGGGSYAFGCGVNGGPSNPLYTTPVLGGTARATFLLRNFTAK